MQIQPSLLSQRSRGFQRSKRLRWYEEASMNFGARFGHAMCFHKPQNRIYIFGGVNQNMAMLNDLRHFCLRKRRWSLDVYEYPQLDGPEAMSFATLLSYKDSLILFGVFVNDYGSSFRILVLDLISKQWNTIYRNKPTDVAGNTIGHSAVVMEEKVIFFGGITRWNEVTNRIFVYFPETTAIQVVDVDYPPIPRVLPALCVLDQRRILIIGGRSSLQQPFTRHEDAFQIDFDDEFKTAKCTKLEIENPEIFPPSVYAHTSTEDGKLIIVSTPARCSHVSVDSQYLQRLFQQGKATERFFDIKHEKLPLFLCLYRNKAAELGEIDHSSYPKPSNVYQFASAIKSFEHTAPIRLSTYIEDDQSFLETLNYSWRDAVATVERLRGFTMYAHDHFHCLLWLTRDHPTDKCNTHQGSMMCYKVGGCVYNSLRQFYSRETDDFVIGLLKTMYQLYCLSQGGYPTNSPFPPLQDDPEIITEPVISDEFPISRLLELQTLVPVHRTIIDTPLSSTFFTVDLNYVRETGKIRFSQQTPAFNSPHYQQYAPVVSTNYELFTCGGVDPMVNDVSFTMERPLILTNRTYTGY
ncbi:unnamed protein product [Bursaphelenchus xylophilus]|uniref:(pine wood nematode) hypothetical protein n=1 Tax=Bursaphelenchus xylophilus TaxID=6326 RepID=A0A1I7RZS8_BURXY|nr:unnamed protein product [Bursaphelenchus xylophilus]CAG9111732.1 unnamed protein product [Bursaphelenchus xylophilus]